MAYLWILLSGSGRGYEGVFFWGGVNRALDIKKDPVKTGSFYFLRVLSFS